MSGSRGRVRIIGGNWRGRRLTVLDADGLRPTPDRVRETLFNWLMPWIDGAACLDLYAGSGALGLEALSRGAACATLIEKNPQLVRQLEAEAQRLGASALEVVCRDVYAWLQHCPRQYDIIFLDPPYSGGHLDRILPVLIGSDCLKTGALVYMEADHVLPEAGQGLLQLKQGKAGMVHYGLYQYTGKAAHGDHSNLSGDI